MNYARLFIHSDFQDTGKVIILLSEAIKIQAGKRIPYGCFSFDMDNRRMKLFYEKRFNPFLVSISRSRFNNFTPAAQWELIEKNVIKILKDVYDIRDFL